jgi:DNA topoisomerase-2
MLWDKNGTIRRYETAEEIIQDFYGMRLQYYGKRRAFLIKDAEGDLHRLTNRMRFILEVIDGKIVVNNRRKKEIEGDLEAGGYDKLLPNKPKVRQKDMPLLLQNSHELGQ